MDIELKRRRIIEALKAAEPQPRSQQQRPEPIAVVGLSGFFPNSMSVRDFWKALDDDRSLIQEVPASRFDWRSFPALNRAHWGGFIPDIRGFDPTFFGILPEDAELMDPRRRLLLMSVYHTLEDAGYAPAAMKKSKTGVYVAAEENEYLQLLLASGLNPGGGFGHASSMIANHISYHFDFRGPSEFINAMCAGGAVAIHRAVSDLRSGEIRQAVVGAVNLLLQPGSFVHLAGMDQLSPVPSVASFGKNAQGYLRSEGVASLLLKPLSLAEADGDSVYALIRNSAVNFNGREGMSIAAPNTAAHAELIHRCYSAAGIDPRDVGYIEAQGMGNPATDIAEWEAFNRALKQLAAERGVALTPGHCRVSSLKPLAGHMHSASALGALFKIIRSVQTNRLDGILHFEDAHPALDTQNQPCRLLDQSMAWPQSGKPRLAGLHSYSSGGTNAHLLVEEYVPQTKRRSTSDAGVSGLILLSAASHSQLRQLSANLRSCILENPQLELSQIACTLQLGRDVFRERLAIQATTLSDLLQRLDAFLNGEQTGSNLDDVAKGWVRGATVDWQRHYSDGIRQRLHLPGYPFALKDYWFQEQRQLVKTSEAEQFVNGLTEDEVRFLLSEFQLAETADVAPLSETRINDAIRNVLTGTLKIDAAAISPSRNFMDYGLDSINGTRFIQKLEESLDVTIPPKWMFDHPSIEKLSRMIHTKNRAAKTGQAAD